MRLALALLAVSACAGDDARTAPDAGNDTPPHEGGVTGTICGEPGSRFTARAPLVGCTTLLGGIDFRDDPQANLQGLEELREIEGNLIFSSNANLVGLDELANLTRVGGILQIAGCARLESLDGLRSLRSVGGLEVRSNGLLRQSEVDALAARITNRGSYLAEENGWQVRESLPDGGLLCGDGGSYTHEAVVGCAVLEGDLQLRDDFAANVDDLRDLREVRGLLNIFRGNVSNVDGLGNLERVGGDLLIHSTLLQSLSGLRSLRSVGGRLAIDANGSLPQAEAERFARSIDVKGEVQLGANGAQLP